MLTAMGLLVELAKAGEPNFIFAANPLRRMGIRARIFYTLLGLWQAEGRIGKVALML